MFHFKVAFLPFAFLALTGVVSASESDELREKAEIIETKDRLEELMHEARQQEVLGNQERLADIRHQAERVERRLKELSRQPRHERPAPHDEIARRLEHMRIAVEHLNQAGLHEMAGHIAERAEATERELRQHHERPMHHERHEHHERPMHHERREQHESEVMHRIMRQLDELAHEVGRLRQDVDELRSER